MRHCVRWGLISPQKGGGTEANFSAHYCGQAAGWIKMLLGTEVDVGLDHIVLDGDPAPPKRGTVLPGNFRPICCGQTAGWIEMPLGMKVGVGPGDIVLDVHPSPPLKKRNSPPPPISGPCMLWPNGWIDQDAT